MTFESSCILSFVPLTILFKVDILETKYNEKTNSLTFETDKFSDYAILYKDTKEKEAVTPTVTNKETVCLFIIFCF